jgi:serine/threonine-protein kinase SRPK3
VAIKIAAIDSGLNKGSEMEIDMLNHISRSNIIPSHHGFSYVQTLLDSFTVSDGFNIFPCMVFHPLQQHIALSHRGLRANIIPFKILKQQIKMILQGLDYLHSRCKIIHAGITLDS